MQSPQKTRDRERWGGMMGLEYLIRRGGGSEAVDILPGEGKGREVKGSEMYYLWRRRRFRFIQKIVFRRVPQQSYC
jgi:hypothetical protein